MDKIVLIGASDHCRYTIDIIEQEKKYQIAGIIDNKYKKGDLFEGYKVLGYLDILPKLQREGITGGIIAIGDNYTRFRMKREISELQIDFQYKNAIHPSVIIGKNTKMGEGCVFMAGVIVNNDCKIGDHCFLATKASLDHDSQMGDFSSLSPGVTTGGRAEIGECSAIGIGAKLFHYVKVGKHSVIGGSSLVNKDVEDFTVAFGIPAKPIKRRNLDEKYL